MTGWMYLAVAIVAEIAATSALRASHGFSELWPSLATVAGYALAFAALAQALKSVELGVAYAIWSAAGTAVIALIGIAVFGEPSSLAKWGGIALIVAGVVLLNLHGGH